MLCDIILKKRCTTELTNALSRAQPVTAGLARDKDGRYAMMHAPNRLQFRH